MIDELRRLSADVPQLHARQADVTTWAVDGYDLVQSALTKSASPEKITAALRNALVTDEELALMDELEFVDPFADWREELEEL